MNQTYKIEKVIEISFPVIISLISNLVITHVINTVVHTHRGSFGCLQVSRGLASLCTVSA